MKRRELFADGIDQKSFRDDDKYDLFDFYLDERRDFSFMSYDLVGVEGDISGGDGSLTGSVTWKSCGARKASRKRACTVATRTRSCAVLLANCPAGVMKMFRFIIRQKIVSMNVVPSARLLSRIFKYKVKCPHSVIGNIEISIGPLKADVFCEDRKSVGTCMGSQTSL